ncbi:hypothetical protein PR202_ga00247 [Eleusine coracana subsp. coracana]|uniref:Uncharacterized protein n=1 Tax=Eleusine coracana subsp. coracana TaxID=191504 RepID=A0AAV5BGZ0_ELECO|nr:hypothetical protein PR202_ga00247 [Eleusine coracana subsp. coracana]
MEDIDEGDHDNNPQKTPSASSEASIQQEHPTSLILDNNKSSLLEISIEQSVPIDDSVTLSSEVDRSELPSNEIPCDFPSSSNEAFKSKEAQDDSRITQTSEVIPNANSEASMQQERPMSLVQTINKSSSQEISVQEKVLGDSIALSQKIENNDLPSTKEVPDGFPSSVSEAYESKGTQDDPIVKESSEVNVVSQYLLRSREEVQFDDPCADSDKVGCETRPVIPKKVKEDKSIFIQRLQKRQMSLAPRQQVPAPVSRSVSVKNLRMDNTTVDTTTHIESVKVAASKFGGSINWKTRRAQPAQESGHRVLELDKLKNEISECKRQAEASEIAMMSVFDDLEKTNKFIDELKHVLERKQAEEVDAKEDMEFFQFIVQEIQERVVSDDSGMIEEKLKIIQERNKEVVAKLKLVKDESRKLQEDCDTLLTEQAISIRKAQAAYTLSQETERQVEDLTLELKRLKEHLYLDRATLHDAEERMKEATILREIDCSIWEVNLRQAEEELKKCEKLSSIEKLKSEFDKSSNFLLNLKNELAMCTESYPTEEALEQEGGTYKSMEKVIPPRNELEDYSKSIAKELEAVHAKAECRDGMVELPKIPQDAAREADKAKSVAAKAQEELRKTREEIEQIKAALSTMELKLQAVQREIEDAKESERLTLSAIREMEDTKAAVNIELGSPHQMITVDLDEYTSLSKKAHRAEALVHERTNAAIALVEAAMASKSQTLSRLDETFKALEERKQALLDATEQADRATEGKLAMEHELRKWREEGRQRRWTGEASKSKTRPSRAEEIIVERGVDAKCTSKEESCASVHPLSDASGRSSPNDLVLNVKAKKTRKLSFFPRVIMFLGRRRRKALR